MLRPWLWLPPATAHSMSSVFLSFYGLTHGTNIPEWRPFQWNKLKFKNPLGIAGGVDKDALHIRDWWTLGAGFVEAGTVTPEPQPGHSGYRFDRDVRHLAVWNRLGFPSRGVEFFAQRLEKIGRPYHTPIFVNVGKNKSTPLSHAADDYKRVMLRLNKLADAFVINISSPNTEGLRDLLKPDRLSDFLSPLVEPAGEAPLLLKVSPDIEDEQLESVLETSMRVGIHGWVLTNSSATIRDQLKFPSEGGVSGRPLAGRSLKILQLAKEILGPRKNGKLIVSSGGALTKEDVLGRLALGADLVQVYSALIFSGPTFFLKAARQIRGKL